MAQDDAREGSKHKDEPNYKYVLSKKKQRRPFDAAYGNQEAGLYVTCVKEGSYTEEDKKKLEALLERFFKLPVLFFVVADSLQCLNNPKLDTDTIFNHWYSHFKDTIEKFRKRYQNNSEKPRQLFLLRWDDFVGLGQQHEESFNTVQEYKRQNPTYKNLLMLSSKNQCNGCYHPDLYLEQEIAVYDLWHNPLTWKQIINQLTNAPKLGNSPPSLRNFNFEEMQPPKYLLHSDLVLDNLTIFRLAPK